MLIMTFPTSISLMLLNYKLFVFSLLQLRKQTGVIPRELDTSNPKKEAITIVQLRDHNNKVM